MKTAAWSRHELPEGGRLTWCLRCGRPRGRIAWEDGGKVQELLRALPQGGYAHGNGLRTQGCCATARWMPLMGG